MTSVLFLPPALDEMEPRPTAVAAPRTDDGAFIAYRERGDFDIDPPEVAEAKAPKCSGERGRDLSMLSLCVGTSPMQPLISRQLDGAHFAPEFYVQTCGHTPTIRDHDEQKNVCPSDTEMCRKPVAVVAVDNGDLGDVGKTELASIAAGLAVPLYLVSYDPQDHTAEAEIIRGGVTVARTLRGLRLALSEDQHVHEGDEHPLCATRGSKGSVARIAGWTEPLEKTLRKVPGSRHVTVHGAIICDDCGSLSAVADVRPYSEKYRRNRISTILEVAKSAGVSLVNIEHADYHPASREMNILVHSEMFDIADFSGKGSIFDAAGALYESIDAHPCNVGGTWEN